MFTGYRLTISGKGIVKVNSLQEVFQVLFDNQYSQMIIIEEIVMNKTQFAWMIERTA